MMHIWVGKLGHPWCRWWLVALSAPCNYLDRGWLFINYILAGISHISQCDLIQMFPMEHNSVSTISTILYRHKCVKYVRMFSKCGHSSQLTELYNALAFVDVLHMKSGQVYLLCRIYSTEIFWYPNILLMTRCPPDARENMQWNQNTQQFAVENVLNVVDKCQQYLNTHEKIATSTYSL